MAAFRYDDLKAQPPEGERRAPLERATVVAGEDARAGVKAAEAIANAQANPTAEVANTASPASGAPSIDPAAKEKGENAPAATKEG